MDYTVIHFLGHKGTILLATQSYKNWHSTQPYDWYRLIQFTCNQS